MFPPLRSAVSFIVISRCWRAIAAIASRRCSINAAFSAGVSPLGTGILGGSCIKSTPSVPEVDGAADKEMEFELFETLAPADGFPGAAGAEFPLDEIGKEDPRFRGVNVVCGGGWTTADEEKDPLG